MDRIKRFIDCNVPTQICNLKCPYCYVGQVDGFSGRIETIDHSPEEVRAALSKKRMGGTILINFCGTGETLIGGDILPIVKAVLEEGHFAQIVTNGIINKRFDEISLWHKSLLDRLLVKFSYHYEELLRLNKLEDFFNNVNKVRNAGGSISVEVTSGDNLVKFRDDLKRRCMLETGAMPHVTVVRDSSQKDYPILSKYDKDEYVKIWKDFDSDLFDLKMKLLSQPREDFCYGGEWTFYLYLSNGDLKQCYRGEVIDNVFEDIDRPIRFNPIGKKCREPYCFNGHAWMTLGCIPNIEIPSYAKMRNRITTDGTDWLTDTAKEFLSHKLQENNIVYEDTTDRPKVLLVGDSISQGYREYVRNGISQIADVYYPEGIVSFSTYLLRYIHEIAENLKLGSNVDIVYFNVGLWDVLRIYGDEPITKIEVYIENLNRIMDRIGYLFPNAQIAFALTTPVKEEDAEYKFVRLNEDIDIYNAAATDVLIKRGVHIHDMNCFVIDNIKDSYSDFTHFTPRAYKVIAKEIVSYIDHLLADRVSDKTKDIFLEMDNLIRHDMNVLDKHRIIIYGAGVYGNRVLDELQKRGITPFAFLDQNAEHMANDMKGIRLASPEEYMNGFSCTEKDIIIIGIRNLLSAENIVKKLLKFGKIKICTYRVFNALRDE